MIAYAAFRHQRNANAELSALAVSTDNGGSGAPARDAVVHQRECSLKRSPIPSDTPPAHLGQTRMHRLETISRPEYSRLTGLFDVFRVSRCTSELCCGPRGLRSQVTR